MGSTTTVQRPTLYAMKLVKDQEILRQPPAPGYALQVLPCLGHKGDVALFADPQMKMFVALHSSGKFCPTRRNKTIMYNCARYTLKWLDKPAMPRKQKFVVLLSNHTDRRDDDSVTVMARSGEDAIVTAKGKYDSSRFSIRAVLTAKESKQRWA